MAVRAGPADAAEKRCSWQRSRCCNAACQTGRSRPQGLLLGYVSRRSSVLPTWSREATCCAPRSASAMGRRRCHSPCRVRSGSDRNWNSGMTPRECAFGGNLYVESLILFAPPSRIGARATGIRRPQPPHRSALMRATDRSPWRHTRCSAGPTIPRAVPAGFVRCLPLSVHSSAL